MSVNLMSRVDPIDWARKPRSAMAFAAVFELANRGERDFMEILDGLRRQGHVVNNELVRRYDFASQLWVSVE